MLILSHDISRDCPTCANAGIINPPSDSTSHGFYNCEFIQPLIIEYCTSFSLPNNMAYFFGGYNAKSELLRTVINLDMGFIKFFIHNCRHSNKKPNNEALSKFIANNRLFSSRISRKYRITLEKYIDEKKKCAIERHDHDSLRFIEKCCPSFNKHSS